ncbi:MAG: hypothetical protein KI790_18380 [Cyclobacteriaceae bacterium]|nr:hypothetical protein [Cyclobacteriaceae bacterium HetDA_MAG_MS6]
MKTNKLLVALMALMIVGFWSCEESADGEDIGTPTDGRTSVNGDQFLFGTNSVKEYMRGSGVGGPMGFIFSQLNDNAVNGRSTASPLQTMRAIRSGGGHANARAAEDSLNTSCFTETFTEDEADGTYEYILDFGDGCEVDDEVLKGKLIERGSYTDDTFSNTIEFVAFGGEDWEINGTETYDGTWTEDETDSMNWSMRYSYSADLNEKFTDEEEGTIEVYIDVNGAESMDETGYVVESGSESVSVSSGETWNSNIDTPLVLDFNCDESDVFIFVSGLESGSYTFDQTTVTYAINYGDGTCDNIVVLTEDGESEEIDLGEEWDEWEEECGEGHEEEGESGEELD